MCGSSLKADPILPPASFVGGDHVFDNGETANGEKINYKGTMVVVSGNDPAGSYSTRRFKSAKGQVDFSQMPLSRLTRDFKVGDQIVCHRPGTSINGLSALALNERYVVTEANPESEGIFIKTAPLGISMPYTYHRQHFKLETNPGVTAIPPTPTKNVMDLKVGERVFLVNNENYVDASEVSSIARVETKGVALDGWAGIFSFSNLRRAFAGGETLIVVDSEGTPFTEGQRVVFERNSGINNKDVFIKGYTGMWRRSRFVSENTPALTYPSEVMKRLAPGSKVFSRHNSDLLVEDTVYTVKKVTPFGIFLEDAKGLYGLSQIYPLFKVGDEVRFLPNKAQAPFTTEQTFKVTGVEEKLRYANVKLAELGLGDYVYVQRLRLANEGEDGSVTPVSVAAKTFVPAVEAPAKKPSLKQRPITEVMKNPLNAGVTFHFVKGVHPLTQEPGWQPKEISGFDPVAPMMVAHDIMLHEPGAPVTPEEEYKAIGAEMYFRHESGYFSKYMSSRASEALVPALKMLFNYIIFDGRQTQNAPKTDDAALPLENLETEFELIRLVQRAVEETLSQSNVRDDSVKKDIVRKSAQHMLGWARIGYRRAVSRFQDIDRERLGSVYYKIFQDADKYLRESTNGDVLEVTIHPSEYKADITAVMSRKLTA
jgi:hypothetical protein